MNELTNQFNSQNAIQQQPIGALAQSTASREMEEVKGQIFMAKQFPRNSFESEQRILDSCRRPGLASVAVYQYPRGGQKVTGPSIRMAEVLAQNWGNLSFGVQELEQRNGESVAKAFCWDLETNVRQEKIFTVKHAIGTKKGLKTLTDPRDIYEKVANDGARRLRNCILGIIPGDIVDKALNECNKTLAGQNNGPLKDRVSNALALFKEKYRVTQEMIETRFGYNADSFTESDLVDLIGIHNSLKDGVSKVEDWFEKGSKEEKTGLVQSFEQKKEGVVDGETTTATDK